MTHAHAHARARAHTTTHTQPQDVFELTEWFRPGTLKKQADFDPNAGIKSM